MARIYGKGNTVWILRYARALNVHSPLQLTVFFMNLVEVLTILSTASEWVSSSRVMSEVTRVGANIHVTPTFLAASALICGAAFIRTSCYRYLGRQFTFELALQKDHKLVTGGPYSIVRHPSYIGSLMYIAGSMLILVDHGSLWAQVGLWETTHGQLMRACIAAMAAFATFTFVRRTWLEDEILSREFGDEWLAWSKRTPYKLIPYIF